MVWFKVDDSFATHPKVMSIPRGATRLRAIGLWTAIGTWCGRNLTDGIFDRTMIAEHGGGAADARHLLAAGLWEPGPTAGKLQYHDWLDWQPSRDHVEGERAAAAERMRQHRARKASRAAQRSGERTANERRSSASPTRPDPTTAAAAAVERGGSGDDDPAQDTPPAPDLPVGADILRRRLQAHTQLAALRFDQLTPTQVADIEELVEVQGDERLVDVAVRTCRNPPPVSVAAFLGTWRALPPPGKRLHAVPRRCSTHPYLQLPANGVCSSCVVDNRVGDR